MSDASPADSAHARVLLVEDSPDQAYLLSALLERLGSFEVTVVQDGVAASDLAEERRFDLLITDLNVPGMDGFDLTRLLKARSPELPVLAITGYTQPGQLERAVQAGADAVLPKPLDPDELALRLAELLPGRVRGSGRPARVLAVGLRLGDLALGCGGSLAAHEDAGHDVERLEACGAETLDRMLASLETARPDLVYLPTPRDEDPACRALYESVRERLADVSRVLAYATFTSTLDFRPTRYRDVSAHMRRKLEDLDPGSTSEEYARAQAIYWGRFAHCAEAEPFEVLQETTERSFLP